MSALKVIMQITAVPVTREQTFLKNRRRRRRKLARPEDTRGAASVDRLSPIRRHSFRAADFYTFRLRIER
jgi:hypothetical protein